MIKSSRGVESWLNWLQQEQTCGRPGGWNLGSAAAQLRSVFIADTAIHQRGAEASFIRLGSWLPQILNSVSVTQQLGPHFVLC